MRLCCTVFESQLGPYLAPPKYDLMALYRYVYYLFIIIIMKVADFNPPHGLHLQLAPAAGP